MHPDPSAQALIALKAETQQMLSSAGPLAAAIEGFQEREGQLEMAQAIVQAIVSQENLLVEAGTGIGKTFAYLVPALLSQTKVIVSTGTRHLQDQLVTKDLPILLDALPIKPRSMMLKGRSNYLCLQRLEATQRSASVVARRHAAELEAIRFWSTTTRTGDIAELSDFSERFPLWSQVTSTVDNCLGQDCPFYDDCFVMSERRRAQKADLVVVNHHLMFADLALKVEGFGEVLPAADLYIMDEAHQIPETASRFFGRGVSSKQLLDLARDCLVEAGGVSAGAALVSSQTDTLEQLVRRLRLRLEGLPQRGNWRPVIAKLEAVWDEVEAGLDALITPLAELADRSPGLAACERRARQLRDAMRELAQPEAVQVVQWYEVRGRGFAIHATPLDISEPFRDFRATTPASWIFTSATLAVGDRFDLFASQVGLEDPPTLLLSSPFDYGSNALMYLPGNLPMPSAPSYTKAVIEAILPVLTASAGRAFILFTSHRALKIAAQLLERQLDLPLFIQGEAPKAELLAAFRESGNGVLLGAASFWEGVDVRGTALSCVIMDKLPFAAPDDPMTQARIELLQSQGRNAFMEFQLPYALLAAKQGAGRLIRDPEDCGVLVLCDPRISSKPYGLSFLKALPPMPRTVRLEEIETFLAERTLA